MREACGYLVRAARSMANVNLRSDSCCIGVTCAECFREFAGFLLDKVDGAAAESASGQSCADEAGELIASMTMVSASTQLASKSLL